MYDVTMTLCSPSIKMQVSKPFVHLSVNKGNMRRHHPKIILLQINKVALILRVCESIKIRMSETIKI